jgi:3-phosphoshikimate 1-carboxyvinyltransferase
MLVPFRSSKAAPLKGYARIPGDKSISHRALMLALLAEGETMIGGLLEGDDVLNTASACRALGARIVNDGDGLWRVFGVGLGRIREPLHPLDMGNSGTSTRLLAGLIASHGISAVLTGDESLSRRPMGRIIDPLSLMGARFIARKKGCLPMALQGTDHATSIAYTLPVPSAQVKSAILLAGLNAHGRTVVTEGKPTRDHSEHMLRHFGVDVQIKDEDQGVQSISLEGGQVLRGCAVDVPGDPSSAAFPAVAACLVAGSDIVLNSIGINPRRIGLYESLRDMGASIVFTNEREAGGERIADIMIKSSALHGIDVPPERVPGMIDEFPILAMAASCAQGTTRMQGLSELRVKESDRLAMIASGLTACGVSLEMGEDSLTIHGTGKPPKGGATVDTAFDHRIAMSFLILGMVTDETVTIDDGRAIRTSFPPFMSLMNDLGAAITVMENAFPDFAPD